MGRRIMTEGKVALENLSDHVTHNPSEGLRSRIFLQSLI